MQMITCRQNFCTGQLNHNHNHKSTKHLLPVRHRCSVISKLDTNLTNASVSFIKSYRKMGNQSI